MHIDKLSNYWGGMKFQYDLAHAPGISLFNRYLEAKRICGHHLRNAREAQNRGDHKMAFIWNRSASNMLDAAHALWDAAIKATA